MSDMQIDFSRVYGVEGAETRTPGEPWTRVRQDQTHWYSPAADFACEVLGPGEGRSCLVIGSPLFEASELQEAGWRVTYLDVRKPDALSAGIEYVAGDACAMAFADASFDAVSSTCVLCHAGMGRYGDKEREDGDLLMLREVARVLKPGGRAAIMAGPTVQAPSGHENQLMMVGMIHRIFPPGALRWLIGQCGLRKLRERVYDTVGCEWRGDGEEPTMSTAYPDYLCVLLEKPKGSG